MEIIFDSTLKNFEYKTYIALGSFDGLHIGHMNLVEKTVELAKTSSFKSMVYTFINHPLSVINSELKPKHIITNKYKEELLSNSGIDFLNFITFDIEFMKIDPSSFIEQLITKYNVKGIIVGFNYRFGFKNLGDVDLLTRLSIKHGFELHVIDPVKLKGDVVSSSRVRELIYEGDIIKANQYLSRPYMLEGEVIHGKHLGRTIGFPTANIDYDKNQILPQGGVYYTIVEVNNIKYKGITNIGYNPTTNDNKLSVETYILRFDEMIYGEIIKLYFIKKIRDEKKFDSLNDLVNQLKKDKIFATRQSKIIEK